MDVISDIGLIACWLAAVFFVAWGIVIGRRSDRLAKRIAKIYALVALSLQVPLYTEMLGPGGGGDRSAFWIGMAPLTMMTVMVMLLGFRKPRERT